MATLDITPLRSFTAVVAFSGVRRAAEALHLSPAAVTGHIRKLERELGSRLVIPQGRGITLTSDGEELAIRARDIVQHHDDTVQALAPPADDEILVAATEHAAEFLVPTVMALLHNRLPDRSIRLRLTRSAHVRDLVHDARADIALMLTRPAEGSIKIAPIGLQWFGKDDTPHDDIVLFTSPCAVRFQALASLGTRPHRIVTECVNYASVIGAARAGTGMTPLPRMGPAPDGLRPVRGLPPIPHINLYASTSERIEPTIRAEVVAALRTSLATGEPPVTA